MIETSGGERSFRIEIADTEVLRSRGLAVLGVVVSQSADPNAPDFPQTVAAIAQFAGPVPVLAAPRDDETWASALL